MKKIYTPICIAAVTFLAGCGALRQDISKEVASSDQRVTQSRTAMRNSIIDAEKMRVAAQVVGKPYIAGASQPLARDVAMPDALKRPTTITSLIQKGPVDLTTALQQLSDSAGFIITATTDALMPASAFAPRLGGQNSSSVQAPPRVVLEVQNQPLWTVLDDVARQVSASWRPTPNGAEFYRVETRVFQLAAIAQVASTSASLGRNAGSNNVFESQSKSSFETQKQSLLAGMATTVEALLTNSGKATISPENQTLVVTDTKQALDRVEQFVRQQNKAMSTRVRVLIEAIEIVDKDSQEFGLDWNVLYTTANEALRLSPVTGLVSTQAGSLSGTNLAGNYAGTNAVIKALSEVGTVVNRRSFPLLTTSGRPVTQALRTTFNYVDQVQATGVGLASSSSNTALAPTVSQKDETVGTFVTLVPTAKADGTIFLSVSFDITSAQPLIPFTVGSGSSAVIVQQKTIDGTGVIQEVPVRSGQTVVIGGIETQNTQTTARRLDKAAPLLFGGSDTSKVSRSRLILLVTAVAEEGV